MNFIYDIVLNFNKEYYNFFEWNKKDNIINIKKIPLFMVSNSIFNNMKYDIVKVSSDFINMIKDKTYIYSKKESIISCLISNGKEVIGVMFDTEGNVIKRSSLLLDEEEEVLDEVYDENVFDIDIISVKKRKISNINRMQKDKSNYLLKYIKKENNTLNLKYLYYDYFEEEEEDIVKIKDRLNYEITNNYNKKLSKIYDTVQIFNKINN